MLMFFEETSAIKPPPDRDVDSDVYVLIFADSCVRTKDALKGTYKFPKRSG